MMRCDWPMLVFTCLLQELSGGAVSAALEPILNALK